MNKENNQNEQNNNDGSMDALAMIVTLLMCICILGFGVVYLML